MTSSTRRLWLATGLLAATGLVTAATAGAQVAIPTVTSDNVTQVAGIPETLAISMEFARTGPYAYVSSVDTISVLDLTDPKDPQLRGSLTQALFENESMTYGERRENGELTRFVIAGVDLLRASTDDIEHLNVDDGPQIAIVDVTDPDKPFTRSITDIGEITSSTHTVQCVDQLDCRYAYTAGGREGFFSILDFTDLDDPKQVGTVYSPAAGPNPVFTSGAGHYWDFDGELGWHTGSGGAAAFDVSDPVHPVLVNATNAQGIEPVTNDFIQHNSMRPNASAFKAGAPPSVENGNVLLVTEEDYANDGDEIACDRAGSFQTWYVPDLDGAAYRAKDPDGKQVGVGTISLLDKTNAPAEFDAGVTPPATAFCSAHWFDYHQDGFVAQGWYGAGMRILDVRNAREITQYGYATGLATEVWDAYWVPERDAAGVSIPGRKTNLVYTADLVRGIEVFEVTLPAAAAPPAAPPAAEPPPAEEPPATSPGGGSSLPATGGVAPLLALPLLLGAAWAVRRRRA